MNIGKTKEHPPPRTVLVGTEAQRENPAQSPQSTQSGLGAHGELCASASLREEKTSRTSRTSREEIPSGLRHVTNEGSKVNLAQSPQSAQREFGSKENLCVPASLRGEKTSRTSRTSREEIPSGLQYVTNEGSTVNPAQSPQSAQREFGSKGNLCASASLREEKSSRTSRTSREKIPSGFQHVTNEGSKVNPAQSPQSAQREFGFKENLCASASLREGKSSRTSRTSREKIPFGLHSVTGPWLFQRTKEAAA